MYIVTEMFRDLHDNGHLYIPGDTYPRDGIEVNAARAEELAGSANKRGHPLIVNTDAPCDACAVERAENGIDAALNVDEETLTKTVKPAKKLRRSRKKE